MVLSFGQTATNSTQNVPPTVPASTAGQNISLQPIGSLLPTSSHSLTVMENQAKMSNISLTAFQRKVLSVHGDRLVLRRVLEQIANGQTPTYNPRLNISEAEFKVATSNSITILQTVLKPVSKPVKAPVVRDGYKLTFSDAVGLNGVLRGVSFDLRTGDLYVPEGFVFKPVTIKPASVADRSLDIVGGYQWNMLAINPSNQNGINGRLSLYQLGNSQALLTYSRNSMVNGAVSNKEIILQYPLYTSYKR